MLASIPSPSANGFHIGPLFIHAYGLAYVVAVTAAVILTRRRWQAVGGDRELVYDVALWGFPAGVIGGRLYFLATSWNQVPPHWWGFLAIWKGGLGIWGGIALGTLVGLWRLRRAGANIPLFMDAGRAGPAGRPGDRANRQLLQPGAVRWADEPPVGASDLTRAPSRRLSPVQHLPADLPLRADLQPRARSLPDLAGAHRPRPPARPVRAVCDRLQRLSHLGGDVADRPVALPVRPAIEPLRGVGVHARRSHLVHLDSAPTAAPRHRRARLSRPAPDRGQLGADARRRPMSAHSRQTDSGISPVRISSEKTRQPTQ